jgi:fucose permease
MRTIAIALTLATVSLGAMLTLSDSREVLWAGSAFLGLAVAPIFPQLLLVADARLHLRGSTTRWFFVGGSMGSIAIPWTLGQGFEQVGPSVLMPAIAGILAANILCFLLLSGRLKKPGKTG